MASGEVCLSSNPSPTSYGGCDLGQVTYFLPVGVSHQLRYDCFPWEGRLGTSGMVSPSGLRPGPCVALHQPTATWRYGPRRETQHCGYEARQKSGDSMPPFPTVS